MLFILKLESLININNNNILCNFFMVSKIIEVDYEVENVKGNILFYSY